MHRTNSAHGEVALSLGDGNAQHLPFRRGLCHEVHCFHNGQCIRTLLHFHAFLDVHLLLPEKCNGFQQQARDAQLTEQLGTPAGLWATQGWQPQCLRARSSSAPAPWCGCPTRGMLQIREGNESHGSRVWWARPHVATLKTQSPCVASATGPFCVVGAGVETPKAKQKSVVCNTNRCWYSACTRELSCHREGAGAC